MKTRTGWLIEPPFYPSPRQDFEVDDELLPSFKLCYDLLRCTTIELVRVGWLGILLVNENGKLIQPVVPNLLATLLVQIHTGQNINIVGPVILLNQHRTIAPMSVLAETATEEEQVAATDDIVQRAREISQQMVRSYMQAGGIDPTKPRRKP